jgi:arylsulfatase A-like enzyme
MDELYDLKSDPYELENRIDDPSAAPDLARMQAQLDALLGATSVPPGK